MHLTKKEATKPASRNFLQQQARFDKFIEVFNNERPHEALDMQCPAEVDQPFTRPYRGLPDIDYPFHDKTIVVTANAPRSPSRADAKAMLPRCVWASRQRRSAWQRFINWTEI